MYTSPGGLGALSSAAQAFVSLGPLTLDRFIGYESGEGVNTVPLIPNTSLSPAQLQAAMQAAGSIDAFLASAPLAGMGAGLVQAYTTIANLPKPLPALSAISHRAGSAPAGVAANTWSEYTLWLAQGLRDAYYWRMATAPGDFSAAATSAAAGIDTQNSYDAAVQAYANATAADPFTLPDGKRVPASAVVQGPVTLPDGLIVVVYNPVTGPALLSVGAGPTYTPPRTINAALPAGGYKICSTAPGTGGWYLGNALGFNCPTPPDGYTGGFGLVTPAMIAAWNGGQAGGATYSSPGFGIVPGTMDFQVLGTDPNPQANGRPILRALTAAGAALSPNDVNVTLATPPAGSGASGAPISAAMAPPVLYAAPVATPPATAPANEIQALRDQLPDGVTPYVAPGTSAPATDDLYTPPAAVGPAPAAAVDTTQAAPSTSNGGLILALAVLGGVGYYFSQKRRGH